MRDTWKRAALAAALCGGGLLACQSATGNLNIVDTGCVTVTAVAGSGNAAAGSINISAVRAVVKDKPSCAGKKICKFTYTVYVDRNGNGVEDRGEWVIGNSWMSADGSGETTVSVGGGVVQYGPSVGILRYHSVVTFCNGDPLESKGLVTITQ